MSDIIYTSTNILDGVATVAVGTGRPQTNDINGSVSPTGTVPLLNLETRFLLHGGPGGSGNWEH
jgi:hypothetical protein